MIVMVCFFGLRFLGIIDALLGYVGVDDGFDCILNGSGNVDI